MLIIQCTTQEFNENYEKIVELLKSNGGEYISTQEIKNEIPLQNQLYNFVQKNVTNENKSNITKFYNFYLSKIDGWRGKMDIDKLWQQWQQR